MEGDFEGDLIALPSLSLPNPFYPVLFPLILNHSLFVLDLVQGAS
tara:strand:+ start:441 stop:575 length:135 start_codon:yes stop_codon:yes gene_type:complete